MGHRNLLSCDPTLLLARPGQRPLTSTRSVCRPWRLRSSRPLGEWRHWAIAPPKSLMPRIRPFCNHTPTDGTGVRPLKSAPTKTHIREMWVLRQSDRRAAHSARLLAARSVQRVLQTHAKGQKGALVFAGFFDLLDNVHGHRASPRFEPQSELLRESGEDRRATRGADRFVR